ncbi:type I polyketide synthase [bacterium]|nr:type I polyketide synthase [bacterium]
MVYRSSVAIVGIGGLFPNSPSLDTYWDNIVGNINTSRRPPKGRWLLQPEEVYDPHIAAADKVYSQKACFLDSELYNSPVSGLDIDPDFLSKLDPMFRLLLHVGHQTISDCKPNKIDRLRAGIIIGNLALPSENSSALTRDYLGRTFLEKLSEHDLSYDEAPVASINHYVAGLPAGLLAKTLGFQGTCFTIDAACASSLYAIKLAADELVAGRADSMLAGGLSRPDSLYTQMGFSQLRALSPTGTCSPFDRKSDGLVVGEGCGLVMLKRTQDAQRDGNHIYGVIRGIGLSNDLEGNPLTPVSEGQIRAMQSAYKQAHWSPDDVDLIECHATGTPVGDAVEFTSLQSLWKDIKWRSGQCIIGSVKANIGHLLTAAGSAALIKTLLAIKHQTLPPTVNFSSPAEGIELEESPFRVLKEAAPWMSRKSGHPRRAAVSAFGFGGINAHLLVEEWFPKESTASPVTLHPSAKQKSQPIAIVGMGAHFGSWENLEQFQRRVFGGDREQLPEPPTNWWGAEHSKWFKNMGLDEVPFSGFFVPEVSSYAGDFRIPPKEQEEMLPRQLLMLKVATEALHDANLTKEDLLYTGIFIGCGLDLNATNFSFRWGLQKYARKWAEELGLNLNEQQLNNWLEELRSAAGPPLTANRTIGALSSIVASRIAKEFRSGGPAFTLSSEENSGLRALEVGIHLLQEGSINRAVVGAVDFAGDLRSVICSFVDGFFSPGGINHSFDKNADDIMIGEGAAALVLKRLDEAQQDKDRIYAVVKGTGTKTGGNIENLAPEPQTYSMSMKQACQNAGIKAESIGYLEAGGTNVPDIEEMESQVLRSVVGQDKNDYTCGIGGVNADIGHAGAASGLASIVKSALCLHYRTLPPLKNKQLVKDEWESADSKSTPPAALHDWLTNGCNEPRRALISGMGADGSCSHVVLEEDNAKCLPNGIKKLDDFSKKTSIQSASTNKNGLKIQTVIGGKDFAPKLPPEAETTHQQSIPEFEERVIAKENQESQTTVSESFNKEPQEVFISKFKETLSSDMKAHEAYLDFSRILEQALSKTISLQTSLLQQMISQGEDIPDPGLLPHRIEIPVTKVTAQPYASRMIESPRSVAFDRSMCLEFAIGSVEKMLGSDFAEIDTYPTRVRLPDEPLMLVDRILEVEAIPRSMTHGRVVTEHDVTIDHWYLDGGRIPACIAIEAGQADLFLSGYLGIDFITRGKAVYRLLDAAVTFHRGLPVAGETIHYDIKIEKFFRQDQTYLFHFNFEGSVNGEPLLSMRNGCAGFFTAEDLAMGQGIVHTRLDLLSQPGIIPEDWKELVPMQVESYNEEQVTALYAGNIEGCFGELFSQLQLSRPYTLLGGKLKLIDRVIEVNPQGGRYGIGQISAEMDIHPDNWFLTCHFVDDRVMPGTLMYECCLHTLRIYLLRMGWIGEAGQTWCEPVPGIVSGLKCRGQVVETSGIVTYQVSIKELGFQPEPFAVADALMFVDGRPIVEVTNMSVSLAGLDREKTEALWQPVSQDRADFPVKQILFDTDRIIAFATGNPSEAFGGQYGVFDQERKIARLPGPPYLFLDRIVTTSGEPWKMVEGVTVEAEYDILPDAWYFAANRQTNIPFSILLEIGLQSCGWLAAYMGSALTSTVDLSFRNLDGNAIQLRPVTSKSGTLTTLAKITRIASSGGMIIQGYDFEIHDRFGPVYRGDTVFGFFSRESLAQQVGIRDGSLYQPNEEEMRRSEHFSYPVDSPYPDTMLRMVDNIEVFDPKGGPNQLGFIRGSMLVNPQAWFFEAHFYQDPVCPGSLGLESFLQLLKVVAAKRWGVDSTTRFETVVIGKKHSWNYRGQIIPESKEVTVEAVVTSIDDDKKSLTADGYLSVDGITIYRLKDFSLALS